MNNRLKSLIEQLDGFRNSGNTSVETATFSPSVTAPSYAYFTPLHYEANYAYPLLVWLHSADATEHQLKKMMPLVSMRNYVAVAARGTQACEGSLGFDWPQSHKHILRAGQRVLDAVDLAKQKFHINPRRIFLAGSGSGGTMAFRLAMQYPEQFAGALSLGGRFPNNHAPLSRLPVARQVELFLACGRDAQSYPIEEACQDLRLFHTAGISVALRQYPCGDEIMPQMLSDMDRWIMELISKAPVESNADFAPTFPNFD